MINAFNKPRQTIAHFTQASLIFFLIVLFIPLSACKKNISGDQSVEASATKDTVFHEVDHVALFAFGKKQYQTALIEHDKLVLAINTFVLQPSEDNLHQAQLQWHANHKANQALNYFYTIARLSPHTFKSLDHLQFRIAAQPIQPGFIDSFGEYIYSGLVHDIGLELTETQLEQQHGLTDPEEAVLGLYAIQFLLFGEHGNRPASDFEIKTSIPKTLTAQGVRNLREIASNRRRTLLSLQASVLQKDMLAMATSWQKENSRSILAKLNKLNENEKNRICRQALTHHLTQTLTHLATLANQIGTEISTKKDAETDSNNQNIHLEKPHFDNQYTMTILNIDLAKQLIPMIMPEQEHASLFENLNASKMALVQNQKPLADTDALNSTHTNKSSEQVTHLLTTAYQQLKQATDQLQ